MLSVEIVVGFVGFVGVVGWGGGGGGGFGGILGIWVWRSKFLVGGFVSCLGDSRFWDLFRGLSWYVLM